MASAADSEPSGAPEEEPVGPRDVNPADRFALGGKPLDLGDLVRATMGELAERDAVEPEPQPEAQPFPVIWGARRPAANPAEADLPAEDEAARADNDS